MGVIPPNLLSYVPVNKMYKIRKDSVFEFLLEIKLRNLFSISVSSNVYIISVFFFYFKYAM